MSIPLIGITSRNTTNESGLPVVQIMRAYVTALIDAGAVPILIPTDLPEDAWRTLYDRLDGILFSGGADIDPENFAGQPHLLLMMIPPNDVS